MLRISLRPGNQQVIDGKGQPECLKCVYLMISLAHPEDTHKWADSFARVSVSRKRPTCRLGSTCLPTSTHCRTQTPSARRKQTSAVRCSTARCVVTSRGSVCVGSSGSLWYRTVHYGSGWYFVEIGWCAVVPQCAVVPDSSLWHLAMCYGTGRFAVVLSSVYVRPSFRRIT